jgi:hypothetical protein
MYFALEVKRVSLCGDIYFDTIIVRGPDLRGSL